VGVNVSRSWLLEAATGGDSRRLNFWDHVVNRIKSLACLVGRVNIYRLVVALFS
jgi:hypothetical protein